MKLLAMHRIGGTLSSKLNQDLSTQVPVLHSGYKIPLTYLPVFRMCYMY